jgi:hypothetical protein
MARYVAIERGLIVATRATRFTSVRGVFCFCSDMPLFQASAKSRRGKLELDQRGEHGDKKKGISAIFAKVPPSCARTLLPKRRRKNSDF